METIDWVFSFIVIVFIGVLVWGAIHIHNLNGENQAQREKISARYYCVLDKDVLKINSWDGASLREIDFPVFDNNWTEKLEEGDEILSEYGMNTSQCFTLGFVDQSICANNNLTHPLFQIFKSQNCGRRG